jgi:hypothetical protein
LIKQCINLYFLCFFEISKIILIRKASVVAQVVPQHCLKYREKSDNSKTNKSKKGAARTKQTQQGNKQTEKQ